VRNEACPLIDLRATKNIYFGKDFDR
jgi:hypothetical protein